MPLSTYFSTPTFRAVDEDAALINQPLSSALEAQLACSHDWLHDRAAGSVSRIMSPAAATLLGYNNTFHTSAVWASMLAQPFLVTRGLSQIKISFLGTIEAFNMNVRLELLGFGLTDAVWVLGGTATTNVYRTITLTLDQPSEYEYETDLILWGRSQLSTSGITSPANATYTEGKLEVHPTALSTTPNATLAATGPRWDSTGSPITVLRETLFRNPNGATSGGGHIGVAILHERVSGAEQVDEVGISRATVRSFFIETRHA